MNNDSDSTKETKFRPEIRTEKKHMERERRT